MSLVGRVLAGIVWAAVCPRAVEMEFTFEGEKGQDALPSAVLKAGEEAHGYNLKGLDALEAGSYDEALDYFEKAAGSLPGYSDAVNNRGVVYFRLGTIYRAREIWEALAASDPDYAIVHYNLGIVSYHEKNYGQAAERLTTATRKNRRFYQAWVMRGRVDLLRGKKNDALRHLQTAYGIAPGDVEVWSMMAYGLVEARDTAAAVAILVQHEDVPQALEMLGKLAVGRGERERAEQFFAGAAARGGKAEVLIDLASVQLDGGSCREASLTLESYFSRARPAVADALLLAGIAAKECNDMAAAERHFGQGIKQFPGDPLIRYNYGQILYYRGQYERAEEAWAPLADTLGDPSLFHLRALAARQRGDLASAERFIERALAMDRRAEYLDVLGVILYERGKTKEAVENFERALKLEPEHPSATLNLALARKDKASLAGALVEARSRLDTCTEDCGEVALRLSVLHYHAGEVDKALEVIDRIPDRDRGERIARHEAVYCRMKGDLPRALRVLEEARKRYVLEIETEYELGECYMQAGLHARAIEVFEALQDRWNRNAWRLFYQTGYAHMERNDLDRAREYFEKSLRARRDNPAARALLAFVHKRQGNDDEARKLWERNLKADPSNPVMWTNMGLVLEQEGDFEGALARYSEARRLKPDEKGLSINVGNAHLALHRYREAIDAYSDALKSGKRDIAAYNLFVAAQRMRNREKADEMVRLLKTEFPASVHARRAEGEMALWRGDTTRALERLGGLTEKNEQDWYTLALVYIGRGMKREARDAMDRLPRDTSWTRALKELGARQAFAEGNYQEAHKGWKELVDTTFYTQYNLALSALQAGDFAEALRVAKSLIGKCEGTDRTNLCRLIGNAAFGLKQWETARTWYEQLSGLDTRNPVVQYNLAVAYYNLGNIEKAWIHYQQARGLDPSISNADIENRRAAQGRLADSTAVLDSVEMWYNQAIEYQNAGRDTAALELYRKALIRDPRFYAAWNNLGALYSAWGELEEAKECYRKAIERRHDLVEAYANLANIHIALNEYTMARRWIFKGINHNPDSPLLVEMQQKLEQTMASDSGEGGDE